MTFGQIKKRVLEQAGENAEDIAEFDSLIDQYVNEGYHYAVQRAYRPRGRALLDAQEAAEGVNLARLTRALGVEDVRCGGRRVPYSLEDGTLKVPAGATGASGASGAAGATGASGAEVEVTYVHDEPDLMEDRDAPRLPAWVHGSLADYATWRLLSNGGASRQSRAEFYRQRFLEAFLRIRPEGAQSAGIENMHGLHECT